VPFLCARPTRWTQPAIAVGAVWAGLGYMYLTQFDDTGWWVNHEWWAVSSVAVIPFLLLAMPWSRRVRRPAKSVTVSQEALVTTGSP
jgi:hypothetical protein